MSGSADEFKRFETEGWARVAESYASLSGRLDRRAAEPLLDAALTARGDRVLDVGTGPGHVAAIALERGAEAVGVDIAEEMVAVARRENPRIEFVVGDAEDLPIEERSFDVVTAGFVINHLPRPERAVAEFARVLRPRGRVAFSVWDDDDLNPAYRIAAEAIEAVGGEVEDPVPGGAPDPSRFARASEAEALLRGAGLRGFEMRHLELGWPVVSGEALWAGLLAGSVRTAARIRARPPEMQRRVREDFTERAERELREGDRLMVPASARIASASKP